MHCNIYRYLKQSQSGQRRQGIHRLKTEYMFLLVFPVVLNMFTVSSGAMHQLPHMTRLVSSVEIRMEIEIRLGKFWRFHVVFGRGLVEMRFKTHEQRYRPAQSYTISRVNFEPGSHPSHESGSSQLKFFLSCKVTS